MLTRGAAPGFYAASDQARCDQQALIDRLLADDELAWAWADLQRIDVANIDAYVSDLVPVALTSDVVVTNHSWSASSAHAYQAVLQGGTSVLVDEYGTPRVQCSCGNPLDEPTVQDASTVTFQGEPWEGFAAETIAVVEPEREAVSELVVVDLTSGEDLVVPVGALVLGGILVYGPDGVSVVDEVGTTTTVIDEPVLRAADDGRGGLVYTLLGDGGSRPTSREVASIWHLPAGATDPVALVEAPESLATWVDLHTVVELGGDSFVVYEVIDPGPGDPRYPDIVGDQIRGDLTARDLDTGEVHLLAEYVSGYEHGISSLSSDGGVLQWLGGGEGYRWTGAVDASRATVDEPAWSPYGSFEPTEGCFSGRVDCISAFMFIGDGDVITATSTATQSGTVLVVHRVPVSDPGAPRWSMSDGRLDEGSWSVELSRRDRQGLVSEGFYRYAERDEYLAVLFDVETGEKLDELRLPGAGVLLSAPLRRPAARSDEGAGDAGAGTDVAPEEASKPVPSDDVLLAGVRNAPVPELCMHPAGRLVDGVLPDHALRETQGEDPGFLMLSTATRPAVGDLLGNGRPEVVGVINCSAGGVSWPDTIHVWSEDFEHVALIQLDEHYDLGNEHRENVESISIEGGELVVAWFTHAPGDAMCCASLLASGRFVVNAGSVELVDFTTERREGF